MSEVTNPSEARKARLQEDRVLSVIWLAEDEVSYLGLPLLLARVPAVAKARVARTGPEAVRSLMADRFDVAVIPFGRCAEVLLRVTPWRMPARVLVSMTRDEVRNVRSFAWHHTVSGYLMWQDVTANGLSDVFAQLLDGEFPVPPVIVRELLATDPSGWPTAPDRPRWPVAGALGGGRLTEREHAVLAQLLKGMSNHQIARAMEISVHGVKRHVSNLMVKFACSNRTEVALAAARLGMDSSL